VRGMLGDGVSVTERLPRSAMAFEILAVLVIVVAMVVAWWPRTTTSVVHSSLRVLEDGTTLEAGFTQDSCGRGGELYVLERGGAVIAWVEARTHGRSCSEEALHRVTHAVLREPLDGRVLVNCAVEAVTGCPQSRGD
jgi:hypothetical protein